MILTDALLGPTPDRPLFRFSGAFRPGRIHIILGKSGSGKTVFLKTLAGFLPLLGGSSEPEIPAEQQPALCFPEPEDLFFEETAGDEIQVGLRSSGLLRVEQEACSRNWLEKWGLPAVVFWARRPFSLSGGEQRRLALASCTIAQSPLMLLDDPFVGLDRPNVDVVLRNLAELAQQKTVVMATHTPFLLFRHPCTITLIHDTEALVYERPELFLADVLANPDRFPLPEWYIRALAKAPEAAHSPPLPFPEMVAAYFRSLTGTPGIFGRAK
jgi:energy-coupling factor transport system ATP-binding protein